MNQEKVGALIKQIRKDHNLTQQQFATRYGVTYQAVSKWENGKNMPDLSLLKQICEDFDLSLDQLLNGEYGEPPKKKFPYWILFLVFLVLLLLLFFFFHRKEDFEFKVLTTACSNFTISGSIAYNESKSSIHISHIEYCGGNDLEQYKSIECALLETNQGFETKISTCQEPLNDSMTLEDYLKKVNFIVEDYPRICKTYTDENLFLRISATNQEDKVITYEIPLSLTESCSK